VKVEREVQKRRKLADCNEWGLSDEMHAVKVPRCLRMRAAGCFPKEREFTRHCSVVWQLGNIYIAGGCCSSAAYSCLV